MAQRKKKLTKKKRHAANREPEADSDSGDFELAAEVKDDDSVRNCILKQLNDSVCFTAPSEKNLCWMTPTVVSHQYLLLSLHQGV